LTIAHASAGIAGDSFDLAGVLGPDGRCADMHGHVTAKDGAALLARLPASWRWAPGLWQGPADVAVSANGPPEALSLQMRGAAGDLVAEAESVRDTLQGTAETTLTLRHPGAPRLLALLGVSGAEHFLETGSLAFLAHLHSAPGHVRVHDFTLDAASLHLGGHGDLDLSGAEPGIDVDIQSSSLALPDMALLRSVHLPPAKFHGRLRLSAQDVAVGDAIVAHGLQADLAAGSGVFLAQTLVANVAGGAFTGQFALDTTQPAVALRGSLTGLDVSAGFAQAQLGFDTGKADVTFDVFSAGQAESALLGHLSGDVGFTLHDVHFAGFDLSRVDALLAARGRAPRASLMQALDQGGSGGFSGSGTASVAHGRLSVADASMSSGDGVVSATGTVDLADGAIDMLLGITPSVAHPPHYTVRLTGTPHALKAQPDLGKPVVAPHAHAIKRPSKS
jgi:hypothetical protein